MSNKSQSSFWKIWRNKFGNKTRPPIFVDGLSSDSLIADRFAEHFANACSVNSPDNNCTKKNQFMQRLLNYTGDHLSADMLKVDVTIVEECIRRLKFGKAVGIDNISAEHLKYSHPIVVCILVKLFSLMIHFNHVPDDFGVGLTVPIPKTTTHKINVTVNDFRGITISPIISKIFEHCLLSFMNIYLTSSDLQFGFKKGYGCNHAIYTVQSTIEYFTINCSTVNICALDISKAFDKVNHYALFAQLMDRKVPVGLILLLEQWYSKNITTVKWNACISRSVKLSAGVRQGGVLSPFLFAIFVDDILMKLKKSGLGCYINHCCLNAVMYADDLLLMSISVSDLQAMIDLCVKELDNLDLSVNINKSVCVRIGSRRSVPVSNMVIHNQSIEWKSELRYLGVVIVSSNCIKYNLQAARQKYFGAINGIFGKVGTRSSPSIILSLIDSFCIPILTYGMDVIKIKKSELNRLESAYSAAFAKVFGSFDASVIRNCQFYCSRLPLNLRIVQKRLTFLNDLANSNNMLIRFIFMHWGNSEYRLLLNQYKMLPTDSHSARLKKLWLFFERSVVNA